MSFFPRSLWWRVQHSDFFRTEAFDSPVSPAAEVQYLEQRELLTGDGLNATGVFAVPGTAGTAVTLRFEIIGRESAFRSEFGVYRATDGTGAVTGNIAPGATNYLTTALANDNATTVFARDAAFASTFDFRTTAGDNLGFYLVQNDTRANVIGTGTRRPSTFITAKPANSAGAANSANPDSLDHVFTRTVTTNQRFELFWEDATGGGDGDMNDLIIRVEVLPASQGTAPVLTVPQINGGNAVNEGQAIDITLTAADTDSAASTLRYSIVGTTPTGATLDSTTGRFQWTPSEDQSGANSIVFRVTDDRGLTDEETVAVTVTEVNQAPVLATIADQNVTAGNTATFDADATDADRPNQTLTFSLAAGAPAGAFIDPVSGRFTWNVPGTQATGTVRVTVNVSDGQTTTPTDSQEVAINVTSQNRAPAVRDVPDQTVAEGSTLRFTVQAADPDQGDTVTFSLAPGAPTGVTINATTGEVTWVTTEADGNEDDFGGTDYDFDVIATDSRGLTDLQTVFVTVSAPNVAPVLANIANRTAARGSTLTFTATATDADLPLATAANLLRFSLTNPPAGATIDTVTGAFSWAIPAGQAVGNVSFTVRVDDGLGGFDEQIITVSVTA